MVEKKPVATWYGPFVFLGVIALIIIVLFGGMAFYMHYFSIKTCGSDGTIGGNTKDGFHCAYNTVRTNDSCPVCSELCRANNRVEQMDSCIPEEVKFNFAINRTGDVVLDGGPPLCYCCCSRNNITG